MEESMVPNGPIELIMSSGLIGWLICLTAPVLLVLFIVVIITRARRLGWLYLGLSFIPALLGILGTAAGMLGAFGEISRNPVATAADLAAGIYVSQMTTLMGMIVSIPSVFCASITLAISKNPAKENADVE